jgi:hypothetical protein
MDDPYDANNNIIRSNYQVQFISDLYLEWRVNSKLFKIVAKNILEIKLEVFTNRVNPQSWFIDLCISFDEDGTFVNFFYPS